MELMNELARATLTALVLSDTTPSEGAGSLVF